MADDVNLTESMSRFFGSLSHDLAAGELVELLWHPRDENEFRPRESFPDLEQAAQRAASLGSGHDVFLQATTEPGTAPWETEGTRLLACWLSRPRRGDDPRTVLGGGVAEMRLLRGEPSLMFIQCFPDGDSTCEAIRFYYRSRYFGHEEPAA